MPASIPFYQHDLGEAEIASIAKVFAGPILTTGDVVAEFETRFSELVGLRHTLGLTSCTGGLHMALLALGIGPGDEVLTTPMTFVATSAAIMAVGATPVFVDVEPDTGNLDAEQIESAINGRTKAIMPVHLYGLMCDMRRLRAIADKHNLKIIEDAAHCVEGRRDGIRPGQLSDAVAYSFYATKNMTCGEGGAISCNDTALYERLKLLRLHGMTKTANDRFRDGYSHWDMTLLGWKYNMSNIEAAILLPQFERLQSNLAKRRRIAARYNELLGKAGIETFASRPDCVHAHHVFPIMVTDRDLVITKLQQAGIGTVVNYRAIHLLTYFRDTLGRKQGDFPNAERIGERVLSLPFFPNLREDSVVRTVGCLSQIVDELRNTQ
jgi:dTDP-4-amino-4,6-dideoxygalactose transaminase